MKRNYWLLWFILVAVYLPGCRDEEQEAHGPATPGNVRFAIDARTVVGAGHGRVGAVLPAGASVYVTIADASGQEVYTLKQIALLTLGGDYVSEPLLLSPGAYTLTDFLVTDTAGITLYATPKEGSPLAAWVTDPLPVSFSVTQDAMTGLDVQVLAIAEYSAEEFGYVAFGVEVAPFPYFRLSVFAHDTTNALAFTPVHACILDGTDTIYKQVLPARTYDIAFVGDLSRTYTLSLTQPSYRRYTRTFVLGELLEALDGAPLLVTLTPALTFTSAQNIGFEYVFRLGGNLQDLMVDWGDGMEEPAADYMTHFYEDGNPLHFVSVYGDVNSITLVEFYYGSSDIAEISLVSLPNLQNFAAAFLTRSPTHLDFKKNPLIQTISVPYSKVRSFDLPEGARLRVVDVVGNDGTSEVSLNAAIHAAYLGQIERGYTGSLYLSSTPGGSEFVAPVTEESLAMLSALREYGWTIWPEGF
ncbi:hypothetical protein [Dawidia soli]|uniref:Uncharacterized protein n=1 Tax=Dawidia soli TaxID=2782352 RepID=A0AAP2D884_9BACT|nr:hypothetical protein [Dawidia soli]MBT1686984.1 hypothetical protein [Dawidia soli]